MVDLDPRLLQPRGCRPADVVNAISVQNLVLPTGTAKIGAVRVRVELNEQPATVAELADLPIQVAGDSTIYLRDVANVRDGFAPQTNIVRRDGSARHAADGPQDRRRRPRWTSSATSARAAAGDPTLPPRAQGRAARRSVGLRAGRHDGVIHEAMIAACLTGLMILLFLGSWRSTLIIAVSIPLSILTSVIVLSCWARPSTS